MCVKPLKLHTQDSRNKPYIHAYQSCGAALFSAAPGSGSGQFQKAINKKFKVIIIYYK